MNNFNTLPMILARLKQSINNIPLRLRLLCNPTVEETVAPDLDRESDSRVRLDETQGKRAVIQGLVRDRHHFGRF